MKLPENRGYDGYQWKLTSVEKSLNKQYECK